MAPGPSSTGAATVARKGPKLADSLGCAPVSDERRGPILALLPAGGRGLQIGVLHQPIATKDHRDVWYVDVFSGPELRQKYGGDPNVDTERIVDVDVTMAGSSLGAAVKERSPYDWVIVHDHYHGHSEVAAIVLWTVLRPERGRRTLALDCEFFVRSAEGLTVEPCRAQ